MAAAEKPPTAYLAAPSRNCETKTSLARPFRQAVRKSCRATIFFFFRFCPEIRKKSQPGLDYFKRAAKAIQNSIYRISSNTRPISIPTSASGRQGFQKSGETRDLPIRGFPVEKSNFSRDAPETRLPLLFALSRRISLLQQGNQRHGSLNWYHINTSYYREPRYLVSSAPKTASD